MYDRIYIRETSSHWHVYRLPSLQVGEGGAWWSQCFLYNYGYLLNITEVPARLFSHCSYGMGKAWTKEKLEEEKHKCFLHPGLIQQVWLCFIYLELFDFCWKYLPQYRCIFYYPAGLLVFWKWGKLSYQQRAPLRDLSSHGGEWEGEREERETPLTVLRIRGTVAWIEAIF